jgi:hypothetical protein
VFASCYCPDFKDRYYPIIEEMQEILGLANDSHVAQQRLMVLRDLLESSRPDMRLRFRPGIDGLLRYHRHRLTQQRRQFLRWRGKWEKALPGLNGLVHEQAVVRNSRQGRRGK